MTAAPSGTLPPWIRAGDAAITVQVLARPGASRTEILRIDPRGIVIALAAPPDKGKANEELIRFLARLAGVARAQVSILRGETSRNKAVRIATRDPAAAATGLLASAQKS
jgi:uncharacterized protein (TIGR00251 family)